MWEVLRALHLVIVSDDRGQNGWGILDKIFMTPLWTPDTNHNLVDLVYKKGVLHRELRLGEVRRYTDSFEKKYVLVN